MKKVIIMIVCGIVFAGGGFWGGMSYQKSKTTTTMAGAQSGTPPTDVTGKTRGTPPSGDGTPPNGGQGGAGGNGASGEIISKADNSITIKTTDGSTKIVYFTSSTKISKNSTGSSSDLVVGTTVMANGTTNTDKSIAGTTIMIQGDTN